MYKLFIKHHKNVNNELEPEYFLQDVSSRQVLTVDKNIAVAMITQGEVFNASLKKDKIILLEKPEKETKAESLMQSALWRTCYNTFSEMLYVVEETVETKQPVAVISLDPFRRVLATVVCDRANETYNEQVTKLILSHHFNMLCSSYKGSDGEKRSLTFLGLKGYVDEINEFHQIVFEYEDGSRSKYPCIRKGGNWEKNVKFEIFPKENVPRPKGISKELYDVTACVFRVLEQHIDIYCSLSGDALFFHEYQEQ